MNHKVKTALIFGITGQDGSYLARFLLGKQYRVVGVSRGSDPTSSPNLCSLGINRDVELITADLVDFHSVLQVIDKIKPDEIYNLAGQSSVSLSFRQPIETMKSFVMGMLNILEAVRTVDSTIKVLNTASTECFGNNGVNIVHENTPFNPQSPYATAKISTYWQIVNYRETYGMYLCTGIMSNHESPLRPEFYVTRKIVAAACRIAENKQKTLELGDLNIIRDWGWAPEYVEGMWTMLQHEVPDDYIIATGKSHSLKKFVELVFKEVGLNWENHVSYSSDFVRPADIATMYVDPSKASNVLKWKSKVSFNELIKKLVNAELEQL